MGNLTVIAAVAENNALGKKNGLLWHLPDDFKRFKKITSGHKIIMGRKTFESFPKPLPNRTHIVITRNTHYTIDRSNCIVVRSIEDALNLIGKNEPSFIIGGGEIYALGMKYADAMELTRVHHSFDGDTFFPEIDTTIWKLTEEEYHPKDERHLYDFTYMTYIRA